MGRILAIDYGLKRTGLAVTDPMKIIAGPLTTVETSTVLEFILAYSRKESLEAMVIGLPKTLQNEDSELAPHVRKFAELLRTNLPAIPLHFADERFTSSMAKRAMIDGGVKKMARRDKATVDKISATIILQSFMENYHS